MIHLAAIERRGGGDGYPFDVPVVAALERLEFGAPVTFLVGENGTGKSTLIEAMAVAAQAVTVGAEGAATDPTLAPAQALAAALRLSWKRRTHRGFFLRAEDFFNFSKALAALRAEMQAGLDGVESALAGRSEYARKLARMPYAGSLRALTGAYGQDLDAASHGESFLKLLQARLVPDGLYLLDEPEAALSPTRQIALLALLQQMVRDHCQFVIATHSPILMALPGAAILSLDAGRVHSVGYEELEHVQITRSFLNDPARFLRHL